MSEKVFLNTSVIQYLYSMGLIHILNTVFEEVYIPLEVKEEIERGKAQGVEFPHLDEMDFIKVVETNLHQSIRHLSLRRLMRLDRYRGSQNSLQLLLAGRSMSYILGDGCFW